MARIAADRALILPGWSGSGPEHWQTDWQRRFGFPRLEMRDWYKPDREEWLTTLDAAVAACPHGVVLVAHSLACMLTAHFATRPAAARVSAALLVAPADVEQPGTPGDIQGFAPIPMVRLPFPSILVGSRNDPFCSFDRAGRLAEAWGARFVDAGQAGHINVDAGFGPWPQGEMLLESLV